LQCNRVDSAKPPEAGAYLKGMLSTEQDLTAFLRISARKLRKLRLAKAIPYLRVDRYTRLYDLPAVIAALEIKAQRNGVKK
jgi:hypothetical protein